MAFKVPEKYRFKQRGHLYDSKPGETYGAFMVPNPNASSYLGLRVIATDGAETFWEHVSVSTSSRCPTWDEMAYVKALFWDAEDCVVQFHPPRSEYVNQHPYTLHMWRHKTQAFPLPPSILVGFKDAA